MTDADRERVIDKVRKLLALAEGAGATPGESAAAAARAAEILERYKLSLSELDIETDAEPVGKDAEMYRGGGSLPGWIRMLAHICAKSCGCSTYLSWTPMGRSRRICLVGRKSDTEVATYMFCYLRREIDRLAIEARDWGELRGSVSLNNFRIGACYTIGKRLSVVRDETRRESTSTAIAKVEKLDAKVEAVVKSMKLRTAKKPKVTPDASARRLGMQAAERIELHSGKALEGKRKALKR